MKEDTNANIVGKNLKMYTEKKNISYKELSEILRYMGINISSKALYNIEIGKRKMKVEELQRISMCLGVPMNDFVKV